MSVCALIPVEDYLRTAYSPDCEYVDGELLERKVGERPHSLVQRKLIAWFVKQHGELQVWPEQRVQVSPNRFRIPDVCVTIDDPGTDIFHAPPLIVIEILSKDDTFASIQEKIDDYLAFGVNHVWVIDPRGRIAYVCEPSTIRKVTGDAFEIAEPPVRLPLAELFE